MSLRQAHQLAEQRMRLLEMEASLQRTELSATFEKWEKRKMLAWGTRVAGWGFKLFSQQRIPWLIVSTLFSRLRSRRAH